MSGLTCSTMLQAFASAGGADNDKAQRLQQIADQIALYFIIIDDDNRLARARCSRER